MFVRNLKKDAVVHLRKMQANTATDIKRGFIVKKGQVVDIKEIWRAEQEILDVIHGVCQEHNLKYSLVFGTLLGAVRHGGFIPWDDDIDIIMPREDYERLILIWEDAAPKGYLLQNKRTDPDFTQNFTKIRKDNTTFIQDEFEKSKNYHTGIFVDIFPADRVAPEGLRRKVQYVASAFNLLCSRGYCSGTKGIVGLVEKIVLSLPEKCLLSIYNATEKYIAKWNGSCENLWYSPNTITVSKRYFSADLFEEMSVIAFNGKEYCCVKNTDAFLKSIYGDYMKLPPVEERVWKHHPLLIDFEHNFSDLSK